MAETCCFKCDSLTRCGVIIKSVKCESCLQCCCLVVGIFYRKWPGLRLSVRWWYWYDHDRQSSRHLGDYSRCSRSPSTSTRQHEQHIRHIGRCLSRSVLYPARERLTTRDPRTCNRIINKKPSCRWDSRPYCLAADYLLITDCCHAFPAVFEILDPKRFGITMLLFFQSSDFKTKA